MSNCSKHKKDLFGKTDMKEVAIAIGDLHYEALWQLFTHLEGKIIHDCVLDRMGGRDKLSKVLNEAAINMYDTAQLFGKAWEISKPFMKE